jgi:hypothetical protein
MQGLEQLAGQFTRDMPRSDSDRRDLDRRHVQVCLHGCKEADATQFKLGQDKGVSGCAQNHQANARVYR